MCTTLKLKTQGGILVSLHLELPMEILLGIHTHRLRRRAEACGLGFGLRHLVSRLKRCLSARYQQ
jgi:hypothetical protein